MNFYQSYLNCYFTIKSYFNRSSNCIVRKNITQIYSKLKSRSDSQQSKKTDAPPIWLFAWLKVLFGFNRQLRICAERSNFRQRNQADRRSKLRSDRRDTIVDFHYILCIIYPILLLFLFLRMNNRNPGSDG